MTGELYLGLMSGTSMDGIEAVLVRFSEETQALVGHFNQPRPKAIQQ